MDHGEFVGIVSERPRNYAWLLGAGASRSAGLPTATDILWDLKRRHYCRQENQEITQQDIQNDAVRSKIQAYMVSQGFPKLWGENEYSEYFERIFGDNYERQSAYLNAILSEKRVSLSVGNRALGALIAAGHARAIFTTNFDTVVEKAVAEVSGTSLSSFHLEGSQGANDALNNERYPLYVKLHGDFRHRSIKNLTSDLASQNAELGHCLVTACNRFGLIVTGYSGRDASVMALLKSVLDTTNPFPHGLYWTGLAGSYVPAPVTELFESAQKRGVKTNYVNIETFDAFLLRLWRNIEDKPSGMDAKVRKTQYTKVSIPMPPPGKSRKSIRINAIPLALPDYCHELKLTESVDWTMLRNAEREGRDELILTKSDAVFMWGKTSVAQAVLGKNIESIHQYDLSPRLRDLKNNLYLKPFIEKALGISLSRGRPLVCRHSRHQTFLIADRFASDQTSFAGISKVVGAVHGDIRGLLTKVTDEHPKQEQVSWSQALQLSVEERNGQFWLVLDPDIWIWPKRARRDATDTLDFLKKDRINDHAAFLLSAWCEFLLGASNQAQELSIRPYANGDEIGNPIFRLGMQTAFSRQLRA